MQLLSVGMIPSMFPEPETISISLTHDNQQFSSESRFALIHIGLTGQINIGLTGQINIDTVGYLV